MDPIQARADSFDSNPDPLAYELAARQWADLVREIGIARLAAGGPQ